MATLLRVSGQVLLVVALVAGWASLRARAAVPQDAQITVLQIKQSAANLERMANVILMNAMDPRMRAAAGEVVRGAHDLRDRAEKALR